MNTPNFRETERLLFRQHTEDDRDAYCAMEADPDMPRYVGGEPRSRGEAEKRFSFLLNAANGGLALWATIYKPASLYIGRCGIYPHFSPGGEPIAGEAALGLYIAKAWWGRGLATEAGQALVCYGFNGLHLSRIVAKVDVCNGASLRIMHKLGFELHRLEEGGSRSFHHFMLTNPASFYSKTAES